MKFLRSIYDNCSKHCEASMGRGRLTSECTHSQCSVTFFLSCLPADLGRIVICSQQTGLKAVANKIKVESRNCVTFFLISHIRYHFTKIQTDVSLCPFFGHRVVFSFTIYRSVGRLCRHILSVLSFSANTTLYISSVKVHQVFSLQLDNRVVCSRAS